MLVACLALVGCESEKKDAGAERLPDGAMDVRVAPAEGPGEELRELVVLLRDELAKKEARIAKLERRVETCEGELEAAKEAPPAGGTGAPLLELPKEVELPKELKLERLILTGDDGRPLLTLDERGGRVHVTLKEGRKTVGPVALEPILSLLAPVSEAGLAGLDPLSMLSRSRPPVRRADPDAVPEDYAAWIRKVAPHEYQILRSGIDDALSDLGALGRQARIVPNYRDGQARGFKLVGVRPGSLYRAMGLRSGDVIRTVNGEEINTPEQAIGLYQALKGATRVEVTMERRRRDITFVYRIMDAFPDAGAAPAEPAPAEPVPAEPPPSGAPEVPPIEKTHEVPKLFP